MLLVEIAGTLSLFPLLLPTLKNTLLTREGEKRF